MQIQGLLKTVQTRLASKKNNTAVDLKLQCMGISLFLGGEGGGGMCVCGGGRGRRVETGCKKFILMIYFEN